MEIHRNTSIGEIVAYKHEVSQIFEKEGIDYCCQGHRSLEEVCEVTNIVPEELISRIKEVLNSTMESKNAMAYHTWPLDLLIDYIEKKHHKFVEEKIQELKPLLEKICKVHGESHPELEEIKTLFFDASSELTVHMKKEELILFPYIRKLVKGITLGVDTLPESNFGSINNPIESMKEDHNEEGERFRTISKLSKKYQPPANACATYVMTYNLLKEFEEDLHLHIHIENNIIFPKAQQIVQEIRKS